MLCAIIVNLSFFRLDDEKKSSGNLVERQLKCKQRLSNFRITWSKLFNANVNFSCLQFNHLTTLGLPVLLLKCQRNGKKANFLLVSSEEPLLTWLMVVLSLKMWNVEFRPNFFDRNVYSVLRSLVYTQTNIHKRTLQNIHLSLKWPNTKSSIFWYDFFSLSWRACDTVRATHKNCTKTH